MGPPYHHAWSGKTAQDRFASTARCRDVQSPQMTRSPSRADLPRRSRAARRNSNIQHKHDGVKRQIAETPARQSGVRGRTGLSARCGESTRPEKARLGPIRIDPDPDAPRAARTEPLVSRAGGQSINPRIDAATFEVHADPAPRRRRRLRGIGPIRPTSRSAREVQQVIGVAGHSLRISAGTSRRNERSEGSVHDGRANGPAAANMEGPLRGRRDRANRSCAAGRGSSAARGRRARCGSPAC